MTSFLHHCRLRMGTEESQKNCICLSSNLFLDYRNCNHFLLGKEWMLVDGQQVHEKMLNREMQIITEIRIITPMRHHLTLARMVIIKKNTHNKCRWGYGEKETVVHGWQECKLVQPLWKTVWRVLKKLKIEIPCNSAILLLVYIQNQNSNH